MWMIAELLELAAIIIVVYIFAFFLTLLIIVIVDDVRFYFKCSNDARDLIKNAKEKNSYLFDRLESISSEVANLFDIPVPIMMVDGDTREGFFAGVFYSYFFSKTFLFIHTEEITGFNDIELRGLFAHEFAHIKRCYKPLAILGCIFKMRVQHEEDCCDKMAVRIVGKDAVVLFLAKAGAKIGLKIQTKPNYAHEGNVEILKDIVRRIQKINGLKIK